MDDSTEPKNKIVAGDAPTVSTGTVDSVAVESPPTPKVPKKGVYVLEPGDDPSTVSRKLFGRTHRAVALFRANPDSDWAPGSEITIP